MKCNLLNWLKWSSSCHDLQPCPSWFLLASGSGGVPMFSFLPQVFSGASWYYLWWEQRGSKVLLSSSTYHLAHCSLVHLFLSLTYTVHEQWTVFHVAEFLWWKHEINPGKVHSSWKLHQPGLCTGPLKLGPVASPLQLWFHSTTLTNFIDSQLKVNRTSALIIVNVIETTQIVW